MRTHSAVFFIAILFAVAGFAAAPVFAQTSVEERAALKAQLDQIEKDIANNQGTLSTLQAQRTTLERDIKILDNKIRIAQLNIKQSDVKLTQLKGNITEKHKSIVQVDAKVARSEASLAQLLRRTREIDYISLTQLALGESLEQFFQDIDDFQSIQQSLGESFVEMAALREDLSGHKAALEEKEDEAQKVRQGQGLAKKAVLEDGKKKKKKKREGKKEGRPPLSGAALFGLRDSGAIPFGTAYQYAKEAEKQTVVRAAVTLGVLRQETNLGENVWQCLLTNSPDKGDGKGKNTGRAFNQVMKGSRDVDPFMAITAELGLDPFSQVVSCPQSSGYGGAMGPAQFIPSTWMLYKDRIASITGQNPPDPWSARTAIFATALLMADNGADAGTRASERLSALRYFAGWANAGKSAYAFYGNGVMGYADEYQADIDILEGKKNALYTSLIFIRN